MKFLIKKFFVEPHIIDFTDFASWRSKKVLEVGCGLATAGIEFAKFGADYTGVELSEESLDLARQRFDVSSETGKFILVMQKNFFFCSC